MPTTQGARRSNCKMAPVTKLPEPPPDPSRDNISSFSGRDVTSTKERKSHHELSKKINSYPHDRPYDVAIDTVPVTIERKPYIPSESDELVDPGTARASIAADVQHPHGTTQGDWARNHKTQTVVQQHCLYFDQDGTASSTRTTRSSRAANGAGASSCLPSPLSSLT